MNPIARAENDREDDDDIAFFLQNYEHGYHENTAFVYDAPFWSEDQELEEEEEDIYGQDASAGLREDRLTLSALREKLFELETESFTRLSLSIEEADTWQRLPVGKWKFFCEMMRDLLPEVKTLDIEEPHNLGDNRLRILCQHLQTRNVTKLALGGIGGDLPKTYEVICKVIPNLECLELAGSGSRAERIPTFSKTSGETLALSLQKLESLRRVSISGFVVENPQNWTPVLKAIRSNPRLEQVNFAGGFYLVDGGCRTYHLKQTTVNALQFGPVLNRAMSECLSEDEITTEDCVEALIMVRHRIDCLDHLFSKVDPNVYAWQAIGRRSEPT